MQDLEAQARRFGTDVRYGLVTSTEFSTLPGDNPQSHC